jgi:VWFA-related protein
VKRKGNRALVKSSAVALGLGLLVLAARVAGQETQKPQPTEDVIRVYTDLVQTDVMVFDKQGHFVNGLRREDFALRVDGQPRPIEFFDHVTAGSAKEQSQLAATASRDTSATVPEDRGRTVFFYVDDFHLSPGDLILLRKALLKFIDDDLGQNDEAVITSASGQIGFLQQLTESKAVLRAAVTRIKARGSSFVSDGEQPPMNEHQALVIDRSPAAMGGSGADPLLQYFIQRALEDTQGPIAPNPSKVPSNGSSPADVAEIRVRARARTILEQAAHFTTNVLSSFESLVDSSAHLPGRKLVFFISDGFYTDRRNAETSQKIDQIIRKATHSGVVIYSLDARALTTGQPPIGEPVDVTEMTGIVEREQKNELSESREGMTVLAVETGGRTIFDTNALDASIASAVTETSVYYLLGWRASHEMQSARKSPRVEVSVTNHPELSVRLGHGFASTTTAVSFKSTKREVEKPSEAKLRDTLVGIYPSRELLTALDLQYQRSDKGILLTASMQIPMESLSFAREGDKDKAVADVAGFIYNDEGKVAQHFSKRMALTPAGSNSIPDEAFTFKYQAVLTPGLYQVRVGTRDEKSGKTGTVHQWIEIPDLSGPQLTLSSVMAGELPPPSPEDRGQSSRMILRANHCFRSDDGFRFLVYAYNAALVNSKPDLVVQARVLRDRTPIITTTFLKVPTDELVSTERIPISADLPLKGLAPGRYMLRITVIDRVAKLSASQEMRMEIQ